MKRFAISPPVAAVLLAIILFILGGFLPNSYGSSLEIAKGQALNTRSFIGLSGSDRCRADFGYHQRG